MNSCIHKQAAQEY